MVSHIDPTQPIFGEPTTLSVRNNFAFAKIEIEALQDATAAAYLPLTGGTITGNLTVNNNLTVLGLVSGQGFTNLLAPYALITSLPIASSTLPIMDGVAAIGSGTTWARSNHVHPSDISIASSTVPIMDGTATIGIGTTWARADHIHPSDTSKADAASLGAYLPLVGGTLSGGLIFANNVGIGNNDTSKQITLYTGYGFGITSNRLNYVVPSGIGIHGFLVNNITVGQISSTGINSTAIGTTTPSTGAFSTLSATGAITGSAGINITGGITATSTLVLGTNTTGSAIYLNAPAASSRFIRWQTAGLSRWQLDTTTDAEAGSDAGANLELFSFNDAGASIGGTPVLTITRATRLLTLNGGLSFGGVLGASTTDLTKHISLHTAGYGFSVTGGRLNYIVGAGGIHIFNIAGTDVASVTVGGVAISGTLSASSTVTFTGAGNALNVTNQVTAASFAATSTISSTAGAASPTWFLSSNAGFNRSFQYRTGANNRFNLQVDNAAESGSNVGSNFYIHRYDDAGTFLGSPFIITRSTGDTTFANNVAITGNLAVTGTLSGAGVTTALGAYLPLVGGSLSGGLIFTGAVDASVDTFARHIQFATGYGLSLTSGRINLVSANVATIVIGTSDKIYVAATATRFGDGVTSNALQLTGPVATQRSIQFLTGLGATATRWLLYTNQTAEGGANAGSDFSLFRYADDGSPIATVWTVARSTGITTYSNGISFGNTNASSTVDLTRHLALATGYGLNVTSSRLNYVVTASAAHYFIVNSVDIATITSTGIGVTGAVTASAIGAGSTTSAGGITIDGPVSTSRYFNWNTAGVARWKVSPSVTAEGGSNAGADLQFYRYADNGAYLGLGLELIRSTGQVNMPGAVNVTGTLTVTGTISGSSVTAAVGDEDTSIATTQFTSRLTGGFNTVAAGDANTTLTAIQMGYRVIRFTGALTADRTYTLPATIQQNWVVQNLTTGGFNIIFSIGTGSAVVVLPMNYRTEIYTDGLNSVGSTQNLLSGNSLRVGDTGSNSLIFNIGAATTNTTSIDIAGTGLLQFSGNPWFNAGLNFGSVFAASTIDLSKHLALYGTTNGINATLNRINHIAGASASHWFVVNSLDVASITSTGLNATAVGATTPNTGAFTNLSATGTVSGAGFTTLLAPYALTANVPIGSSTLPIIDGTATIGVGTTWARSDHIHPTDTTRYAASNPSGYQTAAQVTTSLGAYLPLAGGIMTGGLSFGSGIVTSNDLSRHILLHANGYGFNIVSGRMNVVVSAGGSVGFLNGTTTIATITDTGINSTAIGAVIPSTGAFTNLSSSGTVSGTGITNLLAPYALTTNVPVASSTLPVIDGTATIGVGTTWARSDHIHPTDTTRYAASNPSGYQTAAQVTASLASYLPLTGGTLTGSTSATTFTVNASSTGAAQPIAYFNQNTVPVLLFTASDILDLRQSADPFAITANSFGIQITASDAASVNGGVYIDGYAAAGGIVGRRHRGTAAVPTTLLSNDQIVHLSAYGDDGTVGNKFFGSFTCLADGDASTTSHGSFWRLQAVNVGATATVSPFEIHGSGLIMFGSNVNISSVFEWARFQTNGNFSVGTLLDLGARLNVRQTSTTAPIAIFSGQNNTPPFQSFVTNGGIVQVVSIDSGAGLFAGYAVDAYNNHIPLFMGRKTRGTNAAMTPVQLDDPLVRLVGQGNDGSNTFTEWGNFTLKATALSSVSEHSTYWETSATTTLTQRAVHRQYGTGVSIWGSNLPTTEWMRISPTGNLLIGTATDGTNKLDVVGAARFNGNIGFYNTTPVAKPTVSGAKGSNAALASVIAAFVALGLLTDTTTA